MELRCGSTLRTGTAGSNDTATAFGYFTMISVTLNEACIVPLVAVITNG
jgi:hypothetical protein